MAEPSDEEWQLLGAFETDGEVHHLIYGHGSTVKIVQSQKETSEALSAIRKQDGYREIRTGRRSQLLLVPSFSLERATVQFYFDAGQTAYLPTLQDLIELLISAGAEVDLINISDTTLLSFAVLQESPAFLQYCLGLKADPNVLDRKGETPLSVAVREDNVAYAQLLLSQGANVNATNQLGLRGVEASLASLSHPSAALIQLLMEAGLVLEHLSVGLARALLHASDSPKSFSALEALGLESDEKDRLLFQCSQSADWDWQDVAVFATVLSRNSDFRADWDYASKAPEVLRALVEGTWDGTLHRVLLTEFATPFLLESLVVLRADLNAQNVRGETCLHLAARASRLDTLEWLCNQGADLNKQDDQGDTGLHLATRVGRADIVESLCKQGADVNKQDDRGETCLHIAAQADRNDILGLLRSHGADLSLKSSRGKTAAELAVRSKTKKWFRKATQSKNVKKDSWGLGPDEDD